MEVGRMQTPLDFALRAMRCVVVIETTPTLRAPFSEVGGNFGDLVGVILGDFRVEDTPSELGCIAPEVSRVI
jgi:hypothetical protein